MGGSCPPPSSRLLSPTSAISTLLSFTLLKLVQYYLLHYSEEASELPTLSGPPSDRYKSHIYQ